VFYTTTARYLEELSAVLGANEVCFINQDDNCSIPVGLTAANSHADACRISSRPPRPRLGSDWPTQTDPISVCRNSHYACWFWKQVSRWLLRSNIHCNDIRKGLVVDSTQSRFVLRKVTGCEGVWSHNYEWYWSFSKTSFCINSRRRSRRRSTLLKGHKFGITSLFSNILTLR